MYIVDAQRFNTEHRDSLAKAMARIPLSSEIQEDEGRVSAYGALQKIQTTRLHQATWTNVQRRQEYAKSRQEFTVAARKFCRETRGANLEEYVCEMVGMDGTQSDSSGGLATTSIEGIRLWQFSQSIFITAT